MGDLGACAQAYEEMELCLAESNRDWVKCQKAVKAVKDCMAAQAQDSQKQSQSQVPAPDQQR
jgi:hypothetical protein